jgi:hypothetical protein
MLKHLSFRFRGRSAAICAAFGVASAVAFGGVMVAPMVADAATSNAAQFQMENDADSTTASDAAAAKYQIVQLQYNGPGTKTLVDQIHAADPGVKVLMYADPTITGGFTVGSPSNGCVSGDTGGDSWMLYDGTSQISGKTNLGNSSFDSTCISNAMTQAASADFDGVLWDEMNAVPTYAISQTCINAYQGSACSMFNNGSDTAWENNSYTFIQALGAADSANGMMSILNIGGTFNQPAVWQQWNGPVSGAVEESFVGSYTGGSVPYAQWQGELANEKWSEANGKYEMAIHYDPNQNQESLDTYGLASMLLNAGGMTSYSSPATSPDPTYDFWPEYTTAQNLGAPSGAYTTVTSGGATVYERKFANGIVVVNPTTSASGSVSLGATYSGTGNEPASATSVTLPAQTGMILTGTTPSTAPATAPPGSSGGSGKATPVSLPKSSRSNVSCTTRVRRHKLTLTCTTKARDKVSTSLRVRAYHSGRMIAKRAAKVRHHRATFAVKLNKRRRGTYRFVVKVDAGGKHGKLIRKVRIR